MPGRARCSKRCGSADLKMYLASGTDEVYMKEEARLLGVAPYFDGGVYGALDDYKSFSKKILIQRILSPAECQRQQIPGLRRRLRRDRRSEAGGRRRRRRGHRGAGLHAVDEWKRQRLIGVGADYIVPNYLCREELLSSLFPRLDE